MIENIAKLGKKFYTKLSFEVFVLKFFLPYFLFLSCFHILSQDYDMEPRLDPDSQSSHLRVLNGGG